MLSMTWLRRHKQGDELEFMFRVVGYALEGEPLPPITEFELDEVHSHIGGHQERLSKLMEY